MVQSKPRITWSKDAERLRREFVRLGAAPVFDAVDEWLTANDYLWARGIVVDDPGSEEPWLELVLQIAVEADDERGHAMWRDVANAAQNARLRLPKPLYERMLGDFGVHLLWGATLQHAERLR